MAGIGRGEDQRENTEGEHTMEHMGMFGHVPNPDEIAAKSFSMSREEQEAWDWASYVSGLADAGVDGALAVQLVMVAAHAQLSHNIEPAFFGEPSPRVDTLEDLEAENARLRELCTDMWHHMVHAAWHEESPCPADFADRMRELGIEVE